MRQKITHTAKVYNVTFEKLVIPIYSRYWTFEPRAFTEVAEVYLDPIEHEHSNKGLIVVEDNDDFATKEKEGLLAYRGRLLERIRNYQSEMDEAKKRGSTMEEAVGMKLAKKWLSQIDKRYSVEEQLMQEDQSFLDLDKKEEKRPAGRPKKVEDQVAV